METQTPSKTTLFPKHGKDYFHELIDSATVNPPSITPSLSALNHEPLEDESSISTVTLTKQQSNPRRHLMEHTPSPSSTASAPVAETSTTVFPTVPEQVTVANNQNSSVTHSQVTASSAEEITSLRLQNSALMRQVRILSKAGHINILESSQIKRYVNNVAFKL